jgi:hypothetical protein
LILIAIVKIPTPIVDHLLVERIKVHASAFATVNLHPLNPVFCTVLVFAHHYVAGPL